MTEQEWLACDDKDVMWQYLGHPKGEKFRLWEQATQTLSQHLSAYDREIDCHCIRDIFGNPFRLVIREHALFLKLRETYSVFLDRWLTPTVVGLASAISNGACSRCNGEGKVWDDDPRLGIFENYRMTCPNCQGNGKVDRFNDMPILGDALEDAGCTNEEVLNHCRGLERAVNLYQCQECGKTFHYTNKYSDCGNAACEGSEHKSIDWIPMRGEHVRGCWVLDLILGKE